MASLKGSKNHIMKNKVPNEFFCLAPWTHTFISPQSERRLCCGSREEHSFIHQYIDSSDTPHNRERFQPLTLEEYWNSEKIRTVRKKMLKGEMPPECIICHKKELTITPYKDYFTKELFPNLVDAAIASTDEAGRTTMKPRSFDYRFSNTCNFKCRMCGDLLSSSWEQEKRSHNSWSEESHPWMSAKVGGEIKKFQKEVVEKEFLDAIVNDEVEEIYWVGGEPLLWDIHWQVMQFLVDSDRAKNIYIRYNTNLSRIFWKGKDLFKDLLPHFKGYIVMPSIDGPGEIGEYIRTGLEWNEWVKNLEHALKYCDTTKNQKIVLDVTITLPGLFGLKELVDFAMEKKVPIEPKIVYAFDPSIALSPLAIPRSILNEIIDDIVKYLFPKINQSNLKVIKTLMALKKRATFDEAYPNQWKEHLQQGKKQLKYLEQIRKSKIKMEDIFSAHPKLLTWWLEE